MSANKTIPTDESVMAYLQAIDSEKRRQDAETITELMHKITGTPAVMWGPSIVGFGTYHYTYETGREGDTVAVGFSARKNALVLYGVMHYDQNAAPAQSLGSVTFGKGCIYIKDLSKVNKDVLSGMIKTAFAARNNA